MRKLFVIYVAFSHSTCFFQLHPVGGRGRCRGNQRREKAAGCGGGAWGFSQRYRGMHKETSEGVIILVVGGGGCIVCDSCSSSGGSGSS